MGFSKRGAGQVQGMLSVMTQTSPIGLASEGSALGIPILAAWDDFLAVVDSADLSKPSRLKGLRCRDVLVHLGTWDDHQVMKGLVAAARSGDESASGNADDINMALLARHRDATDADIRAALERSRSEVEAWFQTDGPDEVGREIVSSMVGRLPLLTVLNAGSYELAVHALDLRADEPSPRLLDRGLAALIDVTGALAAEHGIDLTLHAQSPVGGWSFTSTKVGWTTSPSKGAWKGPGAKGSAQDLLDASAGRAALPKLLAQRKLKVQDLTGFLRLAPMINAVPGLPGGAVLRAGVNAMAGVSGGISRLFRR
jgi:uncharacterized protein (TIGR03083 family)